MSGSPAFSGLPPPNTGCHLHLLLLLLLHHLQHLLLVHRRLHHHRHQQYQIERNVKLEVDLFFAVVNYWTICFFMQDTTSKK